MERPDWRQKNPGTPARTKEAWSLLLMEFGDDEVDADEDDDEQERDDGMDTYCLVVDPGQATHYGGVIECEITGTELRLVLTEEAARTLGMPRHTRFVLDLPTGPQPGSYPTTDARD